MKHYPIIPWPGGKRRLAKILLPIFDSRKHTTYVEPFAGGASMLFMRQPADVEALNDINSDVVNLYRVIKHHPAEFLRQFDWTINSRQLYEWAKETPGEILTDIQKAARFYYLQKLAFGGKVSSRTFGISPSSPPRLNPTRIEADLSQAHYRLCRVWVESLPWQKCITRWDRPFTLFFLDPPYWQTEGYGVDFPWSEYEALAAAMTDMQGSAVLTINDHPEIRKLFKGFKSMSTPITYTIAGGDKGKQAKELIYCNWLRKGPRKKG